MIEGEDVCGFCGEGEFDEHWGPKCQAGGWCGKEVIAIKAERDRYKAALEEVAKSVHPHSMEVSWVSGCGPCTAKDALNPKSEKRG